MCIPCSAVKHDGLRLRERVEQDSIEIVQTKFQHTDMSDRGPDAVREKIQATPDHFLSDSATSELTPANTDKLIVTDLGPSPYP